MSDAPAADTPATTATPTEPPVRELRLVVTAADHDEALRFYRDVLGLPERAAFSSRSPPARPGTPSTPASKRQAPSS